MKHITEIERRELQERIKAVVDAPFEHPLPEFFLGPDQPAHLALGIIQHAQQCPTRCFVEIEVLSVRLGGVHIIGRFRYN